MLCRGVPWKQLQNHGAWQRYIIVILGVTSKLAWGRGRRQRLHLLPSTPWEFLCSSYLCTSQKPTLLDKACRQEKKSQFFIKTGCVFYFAVCEVPWDGCLVRTVPTTVIFPWDSRMKAPLTSIARGSRNIPLASSHKHWDGSHWMEKSRKKL